MRDTKRKNHVVAIPQGQKSDCWKALAMALGKLCKAEDIMRNHGLEKEVKRKDNLPLCHNHDMGANGKMNTVVEKRRDILEQRCLVGWLRDVLSVGTHLSELRRWGIKS